MAFSVVCLDAIFLAAWRWARPAAMILAALTISTTFLFELPAVKCRQTNVDLIAAQSFQRGGSKRLCDRPSMAIVA